MFYYTIAALKFATTMPFRETESGFYEIIRYLKSVVALAKFETGREKLNLLLATKPMPHNLLLKRTRNQGNLTIPFATVVGFFTVRQCLIACT
jgi:hypothetical protein